MRIVAAIVLPTVAFLDSVRKVDAFVHLVVLEAGRGREEADDLHLLGAGVVQHVHRAARKEDRACRP